MSKEEALKFKTIFYSKPFIEKFGDWITAGNDFTSLPKEEQTPEREAVIMWRCRVTIPLDDGYEPMLN